MNHDSRYPQLVSALLRRYVALSLPVARRAHEPPRENRVEAKFALTSVERSTAQT